MGFNPFKGRQRGQRDKNAIRPPYPGYDWEACVAGMQSDPNMASDKFAMLMGSNGMTAAASDPSIIARYQELARKEAERRTMLAQQRQNQTAQQQNQQPAPEKRGLWARIFGSEKKPKKEKKQHQAPASALPTVQGDNNVATPSMVNPDKLNLVNYTPEQLMQHVDETLKHVHLGMPWPIRLKWQVGEIWSIIGPAALFSGTAGEVFFFIWNNTDNKTAWWVALSILVTVCVLECTFMVVS